MGREEPVPLPDQKPLAHGEDPFHPRPVGGFRHGPEEAPGQDAKGPQEGGKPEPKPKGEEGEEGPGVKEGKGPKEPSEAKP
ncbi:hypothetical protein GCM10007092_02150 [Thermus composti]|nr:hypothetical protein GCM10007092_02150 [Thermus composti]